MEHSNLDLTGRISLQMPSLTPRRKSKSPKPWVWNSPLDLNFVFEAYHLIDDFGVDYIGQHSDLDREH